MANFGCTGFYFVKWFRKDNRSGNVYCAKKPLSTKLATSKNVLFPGHNHLLTTSADDSSLAGTRVIIKVSGHHYRWLAWWSWPGNRKFLEVVLPVLCLRFKSGPWLKLTNRIWISCGLTMASSFIQHNRRKRIYNAILQRQIYTLSNNSLWNLKQCWKSVWKFHPNCSTAVHGWNSVPGKILWV